MGTLSKLWGAFKFGHSVGQKIDDAVDVSGYWATKIFNWMHPDDPRSQGTAVFQYGDSQVTGKGHFPTYDLGSDNGGKKDDGGSVQQVNQSAGMLHQVHDGYEAYSQMVPTMQNSTLLQSIQSPNQSIAPATNTLQDIGSGLLTPAQNGVGTFNTSISQPNGSSLSQLSQGLSDLPMFNQNGPSFLSNPNQCLSPLSNGNSPVGQGQVNNGVSNLSGSLINTNGAQPGGCFGVPNNFGPAAGGQSFGPGPGAITGSGFNVPGFTQ